MNVSFWKHHPVADQHGRQLAQQTIAFQHQFDFNYIKLTPAGSWLAVCYGLTDAWRGDALGRREIIQPLITNPQDWCTLVDFRTSVPRMLEEQLLAAQLTRAAFPHQPVYATVFSPVSQAIQLAGLEQFMRHWLDFPELVSVGLAKLTENLYFVLEEFSRQSIQELYYVIQHARTDGLPPALHGPLSKLSDQPCLLEASRLFRDVIIHLHGQGVYNPLSAVSPKARFHYGTTTQGGVSSVNLPAHQTHLPGLSTNILAACQDADQTRQVIRTYYSPASAGGNSHLMAECVLPLSFPDHQINVWKQAARHSGLPLP
ncbi:hypothetical protein [Spirosoma flavum]|uniref:Uncharacterized protein n=1 Tax=Spirosoma flavum TaxID=2048557 RepID=A0ABW6AT68_9BACT